LPFKKRLSCRYLEGILSSCMFQLRRPIYLLAMTTLVEEFAQSCFQASAWFLFFNFSILVSKGLSGRIWSAYNKLTLSQTSYWDCSLVSTLHALGITLYAFDCGWRNGFFGSDDLSMTTTCSTNALSIFMGYILSDLCWVLWYSKEWPGSLPMILHHVIALTTYTDLSARKLGHNLTLAILLMEVTTPFMNCRWFLSQIGMKHTQLYLINGLIMVQAWTVFRIVLGAYLGIWMWRMRDQIAEAPWFTKWVSLWGSFVLMYALQWFWFVKLVQGALKVLLSKKTDEKRK
jgi:hypothetical protein